MLRVYGTCVAALFGLAFGSFLNVCATRLPEGESIVGPGSHCRSCGRALRWRENIPVASWLVLRGRCSACKEPIGIRYPLVEVAVALTWGIAAWQALAGYSTSDQNAPGIAAIVLFAVGSMILYWLLILLAVLDAENLWLPDKVTLPGILAGLVISFLFAAVNSVRVLEFYGVLALRSRVLWTFAWRRVLAIIVAAGLVLSIRWIYKIIRRHEGIGLGDAKLMAMTAAWLGLAHSLLAFVVGIMLGTVFALLLLLLPQAGRNAQGWAMTKLPLGTFLCVGGILSGLWGDPLIAAYRRLAGF